MLILLRQGKISKWFSGWGQEAISVGTSYVMHKEEYIFPMHRNLGVFTTRKIPLNRLFAQFQGKMTGFTKGRDRSFHFGSQEFNIVGMISHLGPQLALASGVGLASKIRNEKKATIVFTGDGGASEGDFHEALNVASVWDLPVIFAVENNCWGLSTPSSEQFKCEQFIDKGIGYGMKSVQVNGNNILEVISTVKSLVEEIRNEPKPILLELMTFRMRGHEEASGTKYYPDGIQEEWEQYDPIENFSNYLKSQSILTDELEETFKKEIKKEIQDELEIAYAEKDIFPDMISEEKDLFAEHNQVIITSEGPKSERRLVDAIQDGLRQSMEKYDNLIIMGQDVAEYGGVFKVTEGFVEQFGKERVRNTPICESAIVGAGLGLSIVGMKAVVEMQFADFVTCGFNQIVNNLAKIHWRWGQNADVVVRMPTGAGSAAGPFHSQSNEAWFFHTPGLKIVYPSSPYDATPWVVEQRIVRSDWEWRDITLPSDAAVAGQTLDFEQTRAWIRFDFSEQIPQSGMTSDEYLVSVVWNSLGTPAVGYSNFNLACDKNWTDLGDGFVLNSTTAGAQECSWPMFKLEMETRRYEDEC